MLRKFKKHRVRIREKFVKSFCENSWRIRGEFVENSWRIRGEFVENPWKIEEYLFL